MVEECKSKYANEYRLTWTSLELVNQSGGIRRYSKVKYRLQCYLKPYPLMQLACRCSERLQHCQAGPPSMFVYMSKYFTCACDILQSMRILARSHMAKAWYI